MGVNTQSSSVICRHLNFIISPDDEILQQQVGEIRVRDIFILDIHRQTGQTIPETSRWSYCYCQGQMQRFLILADRKLWQSREFPQDNPLWRALISISKNTPCHLLFIIRSVCWFLYSSTICKQQRATENHSRNFIAFCVFSLSWAEDHMGQPRSGTITYVCNTKNGLQPSSMMSRKNI